MNHAQAIREIMVLNNITLAELGRRAWLSSHVAVLHRIQSKTGRLDTILELLEAMGYEIVVRPATEGDLPEGEYALRFRDYPSIDIKKDELL